MKKRTLQTIPLPYNSNSHHLAAKLQDLSWFVYLDSCHSTGSRFDIITALPYQTLITQQGRTTCTNIYDQKQTVCDASPLTLLETLLVRKCSRYHIRFAFFRWGNGFFRVMGWGST